ncbi:hypothetical protein [Modicisalibacter luteus]|uniref:hypothetical protein n=1 Tax=Modicisalibacter luteus TaxID=453962 RepID=UPI003630DC4A
MNDSRASTAGNVDRVTYAHGRRSIDMSASVLMTLFCLALGFQQVAIKAVAADVSPLAQIALRSLVAAVLVGGWCAGEASVWRICVLGWGPDCWWGWVLLPSLPSWRWG